MGDAHPPPDGVAVPNRTAARIPPRLAVGGGRREAGTRRCYQIEMDGTSGRLAHNSVSVRTLCDDLEQTLSVAPGPRGADAVNDEQLVDRAGTLGGNLPECAIAGHHVGRHP